jgi:hypothetical protein
MNDDINQRLWQLRLDIEGRLDRLHDELLAKLRTMARSVGQRTRTDRK